MDQLYLIIAVVLLDALLICVLFALCFSKSTSDGIARSHGTRPIGHTLGWADSGPVAPQSTVAIRGPESLRIGAGTVRATSSKRCIRPEAAKFFALGGRVHVTGSEESESTRGSIC